jgi:CubicO group peptidase (beta-lactamase class C family)
VVADLTGDPLHRYLRANVFGPLGMHDTDLGMTPNMATGYELRARGAVPVADYSVVPVGAGGAVSTPRDMARYLAALLGGGANEHGRVLKPETLATMYAPNYQPDPRVPGMGLAFFRADLDGHPAVEHDGILPGFDAQIMLAPRDGVGVMAFANGAKRGMHWLTPEMAALLRRMLGVPPVALRTDVPHHPEIWAELRGRYRLSAHPTDPARIALGAGAEVVVRRGELRLRFLSPIPALRRGFRLHPDDAADPYVFQIDIPGFGIGPGRVVFGRHPEAVHFAFAPLSLPKVPNRR